MPEHPQDGEAIINPETHHEKSDVSVRALFLFAVICAVSAVTIHLVLLFFFKSLVNFERRRNTGTMTSMARPADMSVPKSQPLLQPFPRKMPTGEAMQPYRNTPVTDLGDMRGAEQRALTSYGWVDQQKGIVHMPIDVAMRVTLQRGLPVQASGAPASAGNGAPSKPGARP
ncbi:MAG TPA: hypothetical protein VLV78_20605 [Thermoanaerobaculia bacterium]|nr:hypothetical protein [Thermoanaerobaculia bacterium]